MGKIRVKQRALTQQWKVSKALFMHTKLRLVHTLVSSHNAFEIIYRKSKKKNNDAF